MGEGCRHPSKGQGPDACNLSTLAVGRLSFKVSVLTDDIDRDTIRAHVDLLLPTVEMLGLRCGVKTCQVHIKALYGFMNISCPGDTGSSQHACMP